MYHILLKTDWWALSNASSIIQICLAVHEILADKDFTATDGLVSQSFIVAFVHPAYVQISLIWGFPAQLSLWKLVYWLWQYKLNEVCDIDYVPLCSTVSLILWILCSGKVSRTYVLLSEASICNEKAIPSVQCCQADYYT